MKRLIALLTILAMLACPVAVSALTSSQKIARILGDTVFYTYEGRAVTDPEHTRPKDEIIIPLIPEGFQDAAGNKISWDGNTDPRTMNGPNVHQLRENRVSAILLYTAGREFIRDVSIVSYTPTDRVRARAAVRIRFVERLLSTKENNYEFRVALDMNNSIDYPSPQLAAARETFSGMISNYIVKVSPLVLKGLDYVDAYGDTVVWCTSTVDNVVADLDNGVRAHLDMVTDGKFYGYADTLYTQNQLDPVMRDNERRESADAIVMAYPEIKTAFKVVSINVKNQLKYMRLSIPGDKVYYVYNEYGEYIGHSDAKLPYSTRYYLADSMIEIDPNLAGLHNYTVEPKTMGPELKKFLGK